MGGVHYILMLILWSPGSQADQLSVWDAPQVCGGPSPDHQEPDPSLSKVGRLKLHVYTCVYNGVHDMQQASRKASPGDYKHAGQE